MSANQTNAVAEYIATMLLRFLVFGGSTVYINHGTTTDDAWPGTQDNYTASSTASHYLVGNRSTEREAGPRTVPSPPSPQLILPTPGPR